MAKLPDSFPGPLRGKVGGIVGSSWKGIAYIKSKPGKRGKKRTDKERANQNRFRDIHNWLQPMLDFLREGFRGYSPTVEGFNAAKSYNLKNAFHNNVIDPSRVLVSYGSLPEPEKVECHITDGNLQVSWDNKVTGEAHRLDQVMIMAYGAGHKNCYWITLGEFRQTGKDLIPFVGNLNYHVYVAFKSHDRKRQSNSVYVGMVNGEPACRQAGGQLSMVNSSNPVKNLHQYSQLNLFGE